MIIIHTYARDVVHKVECPPYQETGFLVCGNCMFNWLAGSCAISLSLSLPWELRLYGDHNNNNSCILNCAPLLRLLRTITITQCSTYFYLQN